VSTSTSEEKIPADIKEAIDRTKTNIIYANENGYSRCVFQVGDIELLLRLATRQTPSSQWNADGREDPHNGLIECERHQLPMGHLTDDELANGAYLNYDRKLTVAELVRGIPPSIAWMTAVKERIRWLSRSLEASVSRDKKGDGI
jgi:hypothetical protein